jgi:hypothetical protein
VEKCVFLGYFQRNLLKGGMGMGLGDIPVKGVKMGFDLTMVKNY